MSLGGYRMNGCRRGAARGVVGLVLIAALAHAVCAEKEAPRYALIAENAAATRFAVRARLTEPEQAPGARATLEITFECSPGYYVWHDTIQVEVADTGGAGDGIRLGALSLPEAKEKDDPFAGERVKYLDGTFMATGELLVAPDVAPGTYGLTCHVSYVGCGPDICELGSVDLPVSLTVLEGPAAPPPAAPLISFPAPEEAKTTPFAGEGGAASELAGHSPIVVILLSFLAGLGLTLTPCVYPLIPVTVALVGATAGRSRLDGLVRSLVYVFGIAVTYSVVGVVAAATGGMFGVWLQHPAVYVALAAVFVLLAGGMFDLYSIDISSQRFQRVQAALRGRWGLLGIWLIGLLSGAAATACIAPIILGALGYVAQRGNMALGFLIFFSMAWGMGTPLVVLGTFTGVLKAIPKSGEWMIAVKNVFGWALLAAAVYFVGKSRLLPEAWFRALVGVGLVAAAVYAGAFDVLTPESAWYARLKKTFGLLLLVAAGAAFLFAGQAVLGEAGAISPPAGMKAPQGIEWLQSEADALATAEVEGKPVLLDFWAEWCAPCKLMLKTTFVDPHVIAESERFVCAKIDVGALGDAEVDRLRERYGLRGVPTVVLISTTGQRTVLAGYQKADPLLEAMQATN